jgi:hypothetical protein
MPFDFDKAFVAALEARGARFERTGDASYRVIRGGHVVQINTENIRAEALRDDDPSAIGWFLDQALGGLPALPPWLQARDWVFPMVDSVDVDLGLDTLSVDLSDRVRQVLVVHQPGSHTVRFVSEADLSTWGISAEEAWTAARDALARIAADTKVELLTRGDLVLGMVHASEFHKASVIFAPSFRAQVPDALGWPVMAVAPARDFVYLLRKDDPEALGRLGAVVVREFRESGYPVSTEVWLLSDDGARAVGAYPVD